MASQSRPVRVAISGGGMAGATLIHGLLKQPNTDVHIFESASSFKEIGAAVGVLKNGKSALELIGPSAVNCLERGGACPLKYAYWNLARGPHAGERVALIDCTTGKISNDNVHRAAFLREMLAEVPASRMHASKNLDFVDRASDESLVLHFTDGTTHECDILVGADGIRSRIRRLILGENNPASFPVPAGWWFLQLLRPYEEIQSILGKDLVDIHNHVEHCYMGDGAFWLHNILSEGNLCQIAVVVKCDPEEAAGQWKREVFSGELIERFASFPAPFDTALKEILRETPKLTAFYMWEHLHASTYVDGAICIIGDAAHATTPWQASGAGMSFEDALILSKLLGRAQNSAEARIALKVYDEVQRSRTQQVVDSSRGTGLMSTGPVSDFDMADVEAMRARLPQRWEQIVGHDVGKHADSAIQLMDTLINKSGATKC